MSLATELREAYGDWPWLVSEETLDVIAAVTLALRTQDGESFTSLRNRARSQLMAMFWAMQFDAALGVDGAFDCDRIHDYFQPAPPTWPQGRRPEKRY